MSWRIQYREKDKKYRVWSTISDGWLTKWSTKKEIQQFLVEEYLLEYKKKIIELYLGFPNNWPDADGERLKYIQDEVGHQAYVAWLETLARTRNEEYWELIESKYTEVMQELGIGEQLL